MCNKNPPKVRQCNTVKGANKCHNYCTSIFCFSYTVISIVIISDTTCLHNIYNYNPLGLVTVQCDCLQFVMHSQLHVKMSLVMKSQEKAIIASQCLSYVVTIVLIYLIMLSLSLF
jgi:hypothetical protein